MTRRERLRRTGILCLNSLRNAAFFRAAHEARRSWGSEQFWVAAHNNCLDIAVLEWCKVFGDPRAKHYWKKTVTKPDIFLPRLLDHLRLTEALFDGYIGEMRTYRDRFVAHLDEENQMNIPNMAPTIKSAQYLYRWLRETEDDCDAFPDAPADGVAYFRRFLAEAQAP